MRHRYFFLFIIPLIFLGCTKDCAKNNIGTFSLPNDLKQWIPAPTERAFAFSSNGSTRDSFHISESTPGPIFFNFVDEVLCESYDGQHWIMNMQADTSGLELITKVTTTPYRNILHLGIYNFALNIDMKDYKIVGLESPIENANGEIEVIDTISFGNRLFHDVIRINILDPGNEIGFTQFHYAKGVGFVHFLEAPSLEWIRE